MPDPQSSDTGLEATEAAAQPTLWDRLKNDLPGLGLEVRNLQAELETEIGQNKLKRLLSGSAPFSETAVLSKDQQRHLKALGEAERKMRVLERTGIVVSVRNVVEAVRRDIEALMNTARYDCKLALTEEEMRNRPDLVRDLSDFPEVQTSVVNYGIVPLVGRHRRSLDLNQMEKELRDALLTFEPRLAPDKLRVEVRRPRRTATRSGVEVLISGEVRLSPAPEHLSLIAEIDFNTAKTSARMDDA
ncbi:MAG: GPW/gp25 family protein [Paracoccaceae bacterium]|nr:GPW/gp25 family protein [Paracoccaceae bacterium]